MAASSIEQAREDLRRADSLTKIAAAVEQGAAPALEAVAGLTHLDALDREVRAALRRQADAHDGKDTGPLELVHVAFPRIHTTPSVLRYTLGEANATAKTAPRLKALANRDDEWVDVDDPAALAELREVVKNATTNNTLRLNMAHRERLLAMGLGDTPALQAAIGQYLACCRTDKKQASPLEVALRSIATLDAPGYFPTPRAVAARVVELANIPDNARVLEPSAGKGDLADAVRRAVPSAQLDVVELRPSLREVLALKGYNLVADDFLAFHGGPYPRIVMNPPFEHGQDAAHVRHAFELLEPGGVLVAIVSEGLFFREDAAAFRAWLAEVGGVDERVAQGAFLESDRPTGVATRIVTIEKPADCGCRHEPAAGLPEALHSPPTQLRVVRTTRYIARAGMPATGGAVSGQDGQLTELEVTDGQTVGKAYVRESTFREGHGFYMSSGERWGEKTYAKPRQPQILELAVESGPWTFDEVADLVSRVDHQHRPVHRNARFTPNWARREFAVEPGATVLRQSIGSTPERLRTLVKVINGPWVAAPMDPPPDLEPVLATDVESSPPKPAAPAGPPTRKETMTPTEQLAGDLDRLDYGERRDFTVKGKRHVVEVLDSGFLTAPADGGGAEKRWPDAKQAAAHIAKAVGAKGLPKLQASWLAKDPLGESLKLWRHIPYLAPWEDRTTNRQEDPAIISNLRSAWVEALGHDRPTHDLRQLLALPAEQWADASEPWSRGRRDQKRVHFDLHKGDASVRAGELVLAAQAVGFPVHPTALAHAREVLAGHQPTRKTMSADVDRLRRFQALIATLPGPKQAPKKRKEAAAAPMPANQSKPPRVTAAPAAAPVEPTPTVKAAPSPAVKPSREDRARKKAEARQTADAERVEKNRKQAAEKAKAADEKAAKRLADKKAKQDAADEARNQRFASGTPIARAEVVDPLTGERLPADLPFGTVTGGLVVSVPTREGRLMLPVEPEDIDPRTRRGRLLPGRAGHYADAGMLMADEIRHEREATRAWTGGERFHSVDHAVDQYMSQNALYHHLDFIPDLDPLEEWMGRVEVRQGRQKHMSSLKRTPTGSRLREAWRRGPQSGARAALKYVFGQGRGRRWDAVPWRMVDELERLLRGAAEAEAQRRGTTWDLSVGWRPATLQRGELPGERDFGRLSDAERLQVTRQFHAHTFQEAAKRAREYLETNRKCMDLPTQRLVRLRIATFEKWAKAPGLAPPRLCNPLPRYGEQICEYPSITADLEQLQQVCRTGKYDPLLADRYIHEQNWVPPVDYQPDDNIPF